ncbi:hypothetical protein [Actinophytocola sp.]|uniref:hypothetical protein n=1 Tax=Actinophytocola sp. TaxID=1872138 RepID=UPI003D6BC0B1
MRRTKRWLALRSSIEDRIFDRLAADNCEFDEEGDERRRKMGVPNEYRLPGALT